MPISLCMIVKDEENFLENCICSVKRIVDEIIIVDTGSKDRTKEIAKKFTDNLYEFKWQDDFSAARNFSIEKSTKDWILILDADETVSQNDLKKIKNSIENKDFAAYSFVQRTYSNDEKRLKWNYAKNDNYEESRHFLGWSYRGITRLFRNDKRIKFIYPVHETVIESIKNIKGKIKQTCIPIHHFENQKSREFLNKKSDYYSKLLMKKIKKWPKAKFYFELACELEGIDKAKSGFYFKKATSLNLSYKNENASNNHCYKK